MVINLCRTINIKNKVKTILICGMLAVGQDGMTATASDSGLLEEVLAETTSSNFQHNYSLWVSDSDDDIEKARIFFCSYVNSPKSKYAKRACGVLINGNTDDRAFVLPHVRAMQASEDAKVATWAASFLLSFGTLDDGERAIARLQELVGSPEITVSSLAVYELLIRHEVDCKIALTISDEALTSDDDYIKLAGARVLTYVEKSSDFELPIEYVLTLLRELVNSADREISSIAAEILTELSDTFEDYELVLPVIQRMAEDPRGPEAGVASWYFNSGPFADAKRARDIARIRLVNPRLRCSKDALILLLGSPSDQELVKSSLRVLLDDSNHYNSFFAAAYFLDYGDEKDKPFAIAAFERIITDLNFPFNNDVVGFLLGSDLEGVYDMVVNHVKAVLKEGKGNPFLREQYAGYCISRESYSDSDE